LEKAILLSALREMLTGLIYIDVCLKRRKPTDGTPAGAIPEDFDPFHLDPMHLRIFIGSFPRNKKTLRITSSSPLPWNWVSLLFRRRIQRPYGEVVRKGNAKGLLNSDEAHNLQHE
jgi:hypothetical protein